MKQSESINKLAAALVSAQAAMPEIPMDGMNPHYRSKFSTLKAVINGTRPVFAEHGLSVLQLPSGGNGEIGLTTRIIHTSGEWIEETATMQIGSGTNPGQEFGKLITYLRRYGLAAAAGVYSDEDTDGEGMERKASKPAKVTAPPLPDDTQQAEILNSKTLDMLVEKGLFEAPQAAAQVMSQLFPKQRKAPLKKLMEAAAQYRSFKQEMDDTDMAIKATLEGMGS